MLLTEDMAKKIYGVSSVVGRTFKAESDSLLYTVTGILENFPANSHISFNILFTEAGQYRPGLFGFYRQRLDLEHVSYLFVTGQEGKR